MEDIGGVSGELTDTQHTCCDHEEEHGGAPLLLPEGFSPVVGAPRFEEGGGSEQRGRVTRHVDGRRVGGALGGFPVKEVTHDGVRRVRSGSVVQRVGRATSGGHLPCALHEYHNVSDL